MRDTLALALIRAERCRAAMNTRRQHPATSRHVGLSIGIGQVLRVLRRLRPGRGAIAPETSSPPD
jgi:hypothetical protein